LDVETPVWKGPLVFLSGVAVGNGHPERSSAAEDVVQVDIALELAVLPRDDERCDLEGFHHLDCPCKRCALVDRPGRFGHDVVDGDGLEANPALYAAPHVAVRQDSLQVVLPVCDQDEAQVAPVDLVDGLQCGGSRVDPGDSIARDHGLLHLAHEPLPQGSTGVKFEEVLLAEVALLRQGHGQGVAHGERRRRAGGGRQAEGTGLPRNAHIDDDVAGSPEGRFRVSRQCDERRPDRADSLDEFVEFGCLAAVGDGDEHIAFGDDAQIAVHPFYGVKEDGRSARAGEGGHDLAADEARLADSRNDDTAFRSVNRLDGS